jgi:hypothetical protein
MTCAFTGEKQSARRKAVSDATGATSFACDHRDRRHRTGQWSRLSSSAEGGSTLLVANAGHIFQGPIEAHRSRSSSSFSRST